MKKTIFSVMFFLATFSFAYAQDLDFTVQASETTIDVSFTNQGGKKTITVQLSKLVEATETHLAHYRDVGGGKRVVTMGEDGGTDDITYSGLVPGSDYRVSVSYKTANVSSLWAKPIVLDPVGITTLGQKPQKVMPKSKQGQYIEPDKAAVETKPSVAKPELESQPTTKEKRKVDSVTIDDVSVLQQPQHAQNSQPSSKPTTVVPDCLEPLVYSWFTYDTSDVTGRVTPTLNIRCSGCSTGNPTFVELSIKQANRSYEQVGGRMALMAGSDRFQQDFPVAAPGAYLLQLSLGQKSCDSVFYQYLPMQVPESVELADDTQAPSDNQVVTTAPAATTNDNQAMMDDKPVVTGKRLYSASAIPDDLGPFVSEFQLVYVDEKDATPTHIQLQWTGSEPRRFWIQAKQSDDPDSLGYAGKEFKMEGKTSIIPWHMVSGSSALDVQVTVKVLSLDRRYYTYTQKSPGTAEAEIYWVEDREPPAPPVIVVPTIDSLALARAEKAKQDSLDIVPDSYDQVALDSVARAKQRQQLLAGLPVLDLRRAAKVSAQTKPSPYTCIAPRGTSCWETVKESKGQWGPFTRTDSYQYLWLLKNSTEYLVLQEGGSSYCPPDGIGRDEAICVMWRGDDYRLVAPLPSSAKKATTHTTSDTGVGEKKI